MTRQEDSHFDTEHCMVLMYISIDALGMWANLQYITGYTETFGFVDWANEVLMLYSVQKLVCGAHDSAAV